jgi:hypothetical protein
MSNIDTSNISTDTTTLPLDTSNISTDTTTLPSDTSNISIDMTTLPLEIHEKCCISNENRVLKNTIELQTAEIGKLIDERNNYKKLYEDLLNIIHAKNE